MIKAIFFDIDGTLLSQDTHEVEESTQKALRMLHEKGIFLFIASGRPVVQMKLMPQSLLSLPFDGFVFLNGQYCIKADGTVLRRQKIDEETLHILIPWLKKQTFACSIFELDYSYDLCFNAGNYEYLKSIGHLNDLPPIEDPVRAYTHDTYQICPYIPMEQDEEFLAHAPGMESARWTPAFADMIPKGGGKPRGIDAMAGAFGFDPEDTAAFGDAGNDAAMLRYAGCGIAMGNGTEAAKDAADYITTDIHADGIWNGCAHLGLL